MWVPSLGGEDPLEKEMATHSSIIAWDIPQTEEPGGGLQSMESQKSWARLSDETTTPNSKSSPPPFQRVLLTCILMGLILHLVPSRRELGDSVCVMIVITLFPFCLALLDRRLGGVWRNEASST